MFKLSSASTKAISTKSASTKAISTKSKTRKPIPAAIRNRVWNDCIGGHTSTSVCLCCMGVLSRSNFECGHIKAHADGGSQQINNLRPICGSCNCSMGKKDMKAFFKEYGMKYCRTPTEWAAECNNQYKARYSSKFCNIM